MYCESHCAQNYFLKVSVIFDICGVLSSLTFINSQKRDRYSVTLMADELEQAGGGWKLSSVAPQWYLSRERKVLLIALIGGSAGNMAALQSQACFQATTATTITLILKGDPVPEAFSL